jgi:hypothetical protein
MTSRTPFPSKAGDCPDTDAILRAELKAAGIPTLQEAEDKDETHMADMLRNLSWEVNTSVIGTLHGWTFKRNWYYWAASGPSMGPSAADALHFVYSKDARVAGQCSRPSPREWFNGFASGSYHVYTQESLNALADKIRGIAGRSPETKTVTVEKKVGYALTGSTGCTCCQNENFAEGIWDTPEEAWLRVKHHHQNKTVSSQYSSTGIYRVYRIDYELLGDRRILLFDRIVENVRFWENDMYSTIRYAGKVVEEKTLG